MTKQEARIEALKIIGGYRDIIVDGEKFGNMEQQDVIKVVKEIDRLCNSMINLANKQSKKRPHHSSQNAPISKPSPFGANGLN